MRIIEETKFEHKEIRTVLLALLRICEDIESGKDVNWDHLKDVMSFIQYYIEEYHHSKEEKLCLPCLKMLNLIHDSDLSNSRIANEHQQAKRYFEDMMKAVYGFGPESKKDFVVNAKKYVELLIPHMDEVDKLIDLVPGKDISPKKQEDMLSEFSEFRSQMIGHTQYEKFHGIADDLRKRYLL